jgi:hypothetical protein
MFIRKSVVRGAVMATIAVLALTAAMPTEASARRLRGGGGAFAAAAIAGVIGTGIAIAASQNRGDYYGDGYYGGGPAYVGPAQGYYGGGGGGYYGGGYYGGGDPSYGPGPHGYGTSVPYVNGHPVSSW